MDIAGQCWELKWAVQKSVRYHARREGFFDRWRLVTSAGSVLFGSAAAVNLFAKGGEWITLTAAMLVTLISTVDLVVGTANMARQHSELKRRFMLLDAEIGCTPDPTMEDVVKWTRERVNIEAEEPPIYVGLDLLCENELARAYGRPLRAQLSRWETCAAHWLRQENIAPKEPAAT